MPKPTGPQWDAFGAEPITLRARMIINKAADAAGPDWKSGVIKGQDAKDVMRAANIRLWDLSAHPTELRGLWKESEETIPSTETLHTTQGFLHAPSLRHYMEEGPPEFDPQIYEEDRPYYPEVLRTTRGTPWIDEGHHRIVASRLNKSPNIRTYSGTLVK